MRLFADDIALVVTTKFIDELELFGTQAVKIVNDCMENAVLDISGRRKKYQDTILSKTEVKHLG